MKVRFGEINLFFVLTLAVIEFKFTSNYIQK